MKHTLILAAILIVIGLGIFTAAMTAQGWDFAELDTREYQTNTYTVQEAFHSIAINTDTADILFAASENGECRIVCYEADTMPHTVGVQDGTLTLRAMDERKWYHHIGIYSESPKITIYLPDNTYRDLTVKEHTGAVEIPKDFHFECIDISTTTGAVTLLASAVKTARANTTTGLIRAENITAENLYLSATTGKISASNLICTGDIHANVSTGKTELTDIRCRNLFTEGDTGRIILTDVIAAETLSIERDTGDVKLERCDAGDISIETDTGDVTGSLLSPKVFTVETDTGRIKVPHTATGGSCRIDTDTGDITITLDESPL